MQGWRRNKGIKGHDRMKRELSKIGDLATYVNGYAFKPSDWSLKGRPIIRIQDLTGNDYQTNYYEGTLDERYKIKKGDLLISWSASIGVYEWEKEDAWLNQHIFKVVFDKDVAIDKKYFQYAVSNALQKVSGLVHGSTMKHLTKGVFDAIQVPLYSIGNQQEIVQRLETIQRSIELVEREKQQLDTLVKSRFIEMFGDPVTNPHGWEKVPLSDLAELKIGPFGTMLHKEDYITGGHPLVNPSHIHEGNIVIDEKLTISDKKYEELSAYHLVDNDVVMGRRGEMGRCAVVKSSGLLCGTGSMIIRSFGEVRADFLQKIISFPTFKKTIEDMAVGQTMPNLNVQIISRFKIIKPPAEVQNVYYDFVAQVDKSKLVLQKLLEKQKLLRAALIQEYFG